MSLHANTCAISDEKYSSLIRYLEKLGSLAVAFSGGQDSTLLLIAAKQALGDRVSAFTINSPYMTEWEINEARTLTQTFSIKHHVFDVPILESIKSNPPNRCYLCKYSLFSKLKQEASKLNIDFVADGTNSDDMSSYRPGLKALQELNILSPLAENDFSKKDIRYLSTLLDLPTWNKPAYACLLSRLPYNQNIEIDVLRRIERAEKYLIYLGFPMVRVRTHGALARIEVPKNELPLLLNEDMLSKVEKKLREYGFEFVTIDAGGYKTGCYDPK